MTRNEEEEQGEEESECASQCELCWSVECGVSRRKKNAKRGQQSKQTPKHTKVDEPLSLSFPALSSEWGSLTHTHSAPLAVVRYFIIAFNQEKCQEFLFFLNRADCLCKGVARVGAVRQVAQ